MAACGLSCVVLPSRCQSFYLATTREIPLASTSARDPLPAIASIALASHCYDSRQQWLIKFELPHSLSVVLIVFFEGCQIVSGHLQVKVCHRLGDINIFPPRRQHLAACVL